MKEKIQAFFKKMTLARWCAALMALLTLLTLFSFFDTNPFWMVDELKDTKKELSQAKEELKDLEKKKDTAQKAYDTLQKEYTEKVAELQDAAEQANKDLDKICSETSFRSSRYYDCYDNNFQCKSLHAAVEEAEDQLKKYQNNTQTELNQAESELNSLTSGVENAKNRITYLEENVTKLKDKLADAVFLFLGIIVTLAGLGAFSAYLYLNCSLKPLGLGAAGALVLGSALSFFAANIFFLANPYLYSAIAFAMFAVIIFKNKEGKLVPFRVIAIVMTVISAAIIITFLKIFTGLLFAVTTILVSFVLVPLDFKEYIKIAKHIFLTVITFGIWLFVWIFHVTKNLNKVNSLEKRKPVNELLLCMFLPFYFVYWLYKNAEYIEFYGLEKGVTMNKISILCFVLGFVCPILSTILMQDKINQIVGKPVEDEKEEAPAEEPSAL